jgi:hypothetical protein
MLKGSVAPVWVWLKVVCLEREIGEEQLRVYKIFHCSLDLINVNMKAALQKKRCKLPHVCQ